MENKNDKLEKSQDELFKITTNIPEEKRNELYMLVDEFDKITEEENQKLPTVIKKKNVFQKIASKIKSSIINIIMKKRGDTTQTKDIIKDILEGKKEKSKVFAMFKDEEIVGFEVAQISEEQKGKRKVGWKPFMYVKEQYRGVHTRKLNKKVDEWFKENDVNFERTSTGINMERNIRAYISNGYKPDKKDENRVYFIKDYEKPLTPKQKKYLVDQVKKGNPCPRLNELKEKLKVEENSNKTNTINENNKEQIKEKPNWER